MIPCLLQALEDRFYERHSRLAIEDCCPSLDLNVYYLLPTDVDRAHPRSNKSGYTDQT